MPSPVVSLMEQKDREAKWAMAKRILPEIRQTFQVVRHIDFDQERVDWFLDVIEHYLPKAVAQSEELSEAEQTEVLGTISSFLRAKPRLMRPNRMRQMLAILKAVTDRQQWLLDFFGVEDGSHGAARPPKD